MQALWDHYQDAQDATAFQGRIGHREFNCAEPPRWSILTKILRIQCICLVHENICAENDVFPACEGILLHHVLAPCGRDLNAELSIGTKNQFISKQLLYLDTNIYEFLSLNTLFKNTLNRIATKIIELRWWGCTGSFGSWRLIVVELELFYWFVLCELNCTFVARLCCSTVIWNCSQCARGMFLQILAIDVFYTFVETRW